MPEATLSPLILAEVILSEYRESAVRPEMVV